MKRFLLLVLMLASAFVFSACADDDSGDSNTFTLQGGVS
jgi:hypothetical protein